MARPYNQARVWRWLKARPDGACPRDIRRALNLTSNSCWQTLMRMLANKSVKRSGGPNPYKIRYYAQGKLPPDDGRGFAQGSAQALIPGQNTWLPALNAARQKLGQELLPIPGNMNSENRSHFARESAPARIAIPTLGDLARQLA